MGEHGAGCARHRREVAARQDRRTDAGERFFRRRAHQGGIAERKAMIDRKHDLSITKQAEVLQISRGSTVGDRFGYGAHDETLMHLASAAHASHPEWVIRLAMHQASSIMDANQAGHYGLATQWLEKAAVAHEV